MSDPLAQWLDDWGEWLDALLATGLATPSREARARIERWCVDAEALGFAAQHAAARMLLEADTPQHRRADAFLSLLLEQDMLVRVTAAQRLASEQ